MHTFLRQFILYVWECGDILDVSESFSEIHEQNFFLMTGETVLTYHSYQDLETSSGAKYPKYLQSPIFPVPNNIYAREISYLIEILLSLMYSRMVLMVVCWHYRMPFDANGCIFTQVDVD